MRGAAAALAVALAGAALAATAPGIAPFSGAAPGAAIPSPWHPAIPRRARAPEFSLVDEDGATVLRVRSRAAAGALAYPLRVDAGAHAVLSWRWKVDRVVEKSDLATKQGDDFAARVYVFFDLPMSELTWAERATLALTRLVYGEALPPAGLCYVWDKAHAPGTAAWNPFWRRIRTVVVEGAGARVNAWTAERRDLDADFLAAFGARGGRPVPAITGIAAGNDTDQTGESATAWFGDFRLEAAK